MGKFLSYRGIKTLWKQMMSYVTSKTQGIEASAKQGALECVPLVFDGIVEEDITVQANSTTNYTAVLWSAKKGAFVAKNSDGSYYSNWSKTDHYGAMTDYMAAKLFVLVPATELSVTPIPNSVYARVSVKAATGGSQVVKLVKVGELNKEYVNATASVDGLMSKEDKAKLDNMPIESQPSIELSEIDMGVDGSTEVADLISLAKGERGTVFRVYSQGYLVGVMELFSDDAYHMLFQRLASACSVSGELWPGAEDGLTPIRGSINGHHDGLPHTLVRAFNINSTNAEAGMFPKMQWSDWFYEPYFALNGIFTGDEELSDEEIGEAIAEAMDEG